MPKSKSNKMNKEERREYILDFNKFMSKWRSHFPIITTKQWNRLRDDEAYMDGFLLGMDICRSDLDHLSEA